MTKIMEHLAELYQKHNTGTKNLLRHYVITGIEPHIYCFFRNVDFSKVVSYTETSWDNWLSVRIDIKSQSYSVIITKNWAMIRKKYENIHYK